MVYGKYFEASVLLPPPEETIDALFPTVGNVIFLTQQAVTLLWSASLGFCINPIIPALYLEYNNESVAPFK